VAGKIQPDVTIGGLTRKDLYCFAFVLTGTWLILHNISSEPIWIYSTLKDYADNGHCDLIQDRTPRQFVQGTLSLIVGLFCLIPASRWATLLVNRESKAGERR
jgi:hypothetical protein